MARELYEPNMDTRMKNNREKNREFENACRDAGLTKEEKQEFSTSLHRSKEWETGDWTYRELYEEAKYFKKR